MKLALSVPYVFYCGRYMSGCKVQSESSDQHFLNQNGRHVLAGPEYSQERIASVEAVFVDSIRNALPLNRKKTLEQLSLLPDEYLTFLKNATERGFKIMFETPISGYPGAAGLAMGGMKGNGYPSWIKLTNSAPNSEYVVLHELGHSTHNFAERASGVPMARQMLTKAFGDVAKSRERNRIWSYAMKNELEFFATAFSSYYYSYGTRGDMETNYPLTYKYFSQILKPAPDGGAWNPNGVSVTQPSGLTNAAPSTGGSTAIPNHGENTNSVGVQSFEASLTKLVAMFAQYFNQDNFAARLNLTGDALRNPQIVLPSLGSEFYAEQTSYAELRSGIKDFNPSQLGGYRVWFSVAGHESAGVIELPTSFNFEPYIADGNIMTPIAIPSVEQIEKLLGRSLPKNYMNVKEVPIRLGFTDPMNNLVAETKHIFKETHVEVA